MTKIIGNTTATPNPRPDWNQTDETKADYIKNKPIIGDIASLTEISKDNLALDVQESLDRADSAIQSLDGYATETYVGEQIASMVDSAPETLNTLNELAAALGNDENFATTVANQLGNKADKVDVGDIENLTTSNKSNLVNAINEVKSTTDYLSEQDVEIETPTAPSGMGSLAPAVMEDYFRITKNGEEFETYHKYWSDGLSSRVDNNIAKIDSLTRQVGNIEADLYQTPITIIPTTLEPNKQYNFGEVTELALAFPTVANDGDVIYATFITGETATALTIDTTNTCDIEFVPEAHIGYEVFGKFNGLIWIVNYSEYTVSEG